MQPSGSYLKIERTQKIERTIKNLKKGRVIKIARKIKKPQNRGKKKKPKNRRNKKEWGGSLKIGKIKRKNIKVDI